jgi:hypothetical protein
MHGEGIRDAYIGEADCVLSECDLFAGRVQSYVKKEHLHTCLFMSGTSWEYNRTRIRRNCLFFTADP